MIYWWFGADDNFLSHFADVRLALPESDRIEIHGFMTTKTHQTISPRDKEFLRGLFACAKEPSTERAAIVLGRNYLEHQTKIFPQLYSIARASNDLVYMMLFAKLGLLHHHVPVSPATHWSIPGKEKTMCAFKEVESGVIWVIDPILKAGCSPKAIWRKVVADPARISFDPKNHPGLRNP